MSFSPASELSATVVFAGYGVTSPENGYDDYRGIDVEGKAVLLLRYVPRRGRSDGPFDARRGHATFVAKALNAKRHGAVALIIVNGPLHFEDDPLVSYGTKVGARLLDIPAIHLRRELADQLLDFHDLSLESLQRSIDEDLTPRSHDLGGVTLDLRLDIVRNEAVVRNVLGYLPPSEDSESVRSSEYVVVGSHYDHLGLGERGSRSRRDVGQIHNGADDNASGVAGMLELARVFSEAEGRSRGILFAGFAGEELGLRGSLHYTMEPTLPLDRAVAMINLDMIGRLRHGRLFIGGVHSSPAFEEPLSALARELALSVSPLPSRDVSSDHAAFLRTGMPSLFFFTGVHGDYHKPSDDAQFINFDGMTTVLDVAYRMTDLLLEADERPLAVQQPVYRATSRRAGYDRGYFGVSVDVQFQGRGLRLAEVWTDGPAERAGLLAGDVLIEVDGRPVQSARTATAILRQYRPGDVITAKVQRSGEVVEIRIKLARWP